jgi:hypothetical protein
LSFNGGESGTKGCVKRRAERAERILFLIGLDRVEVSGLGSPLRFLFIFRGGNFGSQKNAALAGAVLLFFPNKDTSEELNKKFRVLFCVANFL